MMDQLLLITPVIKSHLQSIYATLGRHVCTEAKAYYHMRVCVCYQTQISPSVCQSYIGDIAYPQLFRTYNLKLFYQVGVFMHPVTGVGRNHFSFSFADQQLVFIEQIKKIIPPDFNTMLFELRPKKIMQFACAQSGHGRSQTVYVLQNNIIVKFFGLQTICVLVERTSCFAKQFA